MKPEQWIVGGNTGASSETIWAALMGVRAARPSIPYDSDDFGRCWRLLGQMDGWKARLNEVADAYPMWGPIVSAWDELTALYEAEDFSGVRQRLHELYSDCMIADGMTETSRGCFVRQ